MIYQTQILSISFPTAMLVAVIILVVVILAQMLSERRHCASYQNENSFEIKKFHLDRKMKDDLIQKDLGNPGFMDEDRFLEIVTLGISQPEISKLAYGFVFEKDKEYLFHIKKDKNLTLHISWNNKTEMLKADTFNFNSNNDGWMAGCIYIYTTNNV
jgi:hypothetical protein